MDLELTLDAREAQGKANKRLRRDGLVPGVVYGMGQESTPVQVEAKTFETLYRTAGRTSVVKFRLPGASRATSGHSTPGPASPKTRPARRSSSSATAMPNT